MAVPPNQVNAPFAGQSAPRCPACEEPVLRGMLFCPGCGSGLPGSGKSPPCPKCGVTIVAGARFCAACGSSLSGGDKSTTTPVAAHRIQMGIELALLDEAGNTLSRHPLTSGEVTIGRGAADISFPDDPFLSPLHAKITIQEEVMLVRDLGSRNGTWFFIEGPYKLEDGDLVLIGSQVFRFRRLGYPGPHPPERDLTRRMGSLVPSADIASLTQLRSDGSERDVLHLSPGRNVMIGRESGDWVFPYDPSMSATHAQVRSEDADFVVADAGSRNGIAIAVRGDVELRHGSRILAGDKNLRLERP